MMRPTNLAHLYRIRLRARLALELAALVGIAAGVALLFSASIADTSLTGSIKQLTSSVSGGAQLELVARNPNGFSETILDDVRRLPGVVTAAPVVTAPATVVGRSGHRSVELLGGDPRLAARAGSLLRMLSEKQLMETRAIAIPAPTAKSIGASLAGSVTVEIAGRAYRVPVAAQLQADDVGGLVDSPVILAPLGFAQHLAAQRGCLNRILVTAAPGRVARVRSELERLGSTAFDVRATDFETKLFAQAARPTRDSTRMFSAFSALVGFVFAFSAMLLTVPQRQRMVADLREDGYGPRAIAQVLVVDACVLGLIACGVGLAFGALLSEHLFRLDPGYLAYTFPVGTQRIVTLQSVVVAVSGGMLAALAAVLLPFRDELRTTHRRPRLGRLRSLRRRPMPRRPVAELIGAAVGISLAAVVLLTVPQLAVGGMLALMASLCLLLPTAIAVIARGLDALARRGRSSAPFLAATALGASSNRTRALAVAIIGAIAVMSSVALQGSRQDLERGLDDSARHVDAMADLWITPRSDANAFATIPFPDTLRRRISAVPGVQSVATYRGGFFDWQDRRVWVLAPPRDAPLPLDEHQLSRSDLSQAARGLRTGGAVVLARSLAEAHHLRVGDRVTLPTVRPTTLRVAALSSNLGWPSGALIVDAEDYARAWQTTDASAYHVAIAPGASLAAVQGALARVLASRPLQIETTQERLRRHYASTRSSLARLTSIRTLVLVSAVLAMATAMGGMLWQRRPRLAGLKVDGYSDGEVWRGLVLESSALLGTACLLGAVFGLGGQLLLSHALTTITGFPVIFTVAAAVAAGSFGLVTFAAAAMVAIPGYAAARVPPRLTLQE